MRNEGTTLSEQFRIIGTLGNQVRRKFATIYLAENKISGEQVVLKVAQQSDVALERLKQEAAFSFDQAGLPRVIDFQESDQDSVLILEYQKGISWTDHFKTLRQKERLPELIRLLKLLAPLLNELHTRGIVHLDLKPTNLLYSSESDAVSIIDFGLALKQPLTAPRKTLFPLGYASPEALLNELDLVDHRSDYFSLAVSCYQLLSDKLPLLHPNPSVTTNLQLTHPLPDCPNLSKNGNAALQKLGAKFRFGLPPNQLPENERKKALIAGKELRYNKIEDFISDLETSSKKRWSLF